jgi:hypothetical protein
MEKVISAGIRLMLLVLLVINFSCGEKKTENILDSLSYDSSNIETIKIQDKPVAGEIFEYRSQELPGYELYAIWPFGSISQFLINKNGEAKLLQLDNFNITEDGDQIIKDSEFTAIKFKERGEVNDIITFSQLILTNQTKQKIVFNHSQTKRSLQIGSIYTYATEKESGELKLSVDGYSYNFDVTTIAGTDTCKLDGAILFKGNIGYFERDPYGTNCKLIFFFSDKTVEILSISSNSACGCGANASLNHQFTLK